MKINDKQTHFLAGYAIAITIGFYNPLLGLVAACLAGVGKEVYDWFHPADHTVDQWDFYATSLGGVTAFIVLSLF